MIENFVQSFEFALVITLPGLILLFFGWFLKRREQIDSSFVSQASKLMFNWALPCLLFFSVYEAKTDFSSHKNLVWAGYVMTFILFAMSGAYALAFIKDRGLKGIFVQSVYRGNTAIIGIALCANAYGQEGMSLGALLAGSLTLLFNILAVVILSLAFADAEHKTSVGKQLWGIAKNPLILSLLLAFFWKEAALPMPVVVSKVGHYLSQCTLPLSLICVGATFNLKSLFKVKDFSMFTSVARLSLSPVVAIVVGRMMGLSQMEFGVLLLIAVTPVATASYVMVKAMGGNDVVAANVIAITNFFSMFVAAVVVTFAKIFGWM